MTTSSSCNEAEPWGRYSASGGLYTINETQKKYIYSFGGDTTSNADGQGGVVRTNFRFNLETKCWERLKNSPEVIGYRATATMVASDPEHVYVLFGANGNRVATNQLYKYSLLEDSWILLNTNIMNSRIPPPRWKHAAVALDESRILITGGRDGTLVRNDAWIFDTSNLSFTMIIMSSNTTNGSVLPSVYRHGMAFDPKRNVTWIHGGLDANLQRYPSHHIWQLNMTDYQVTKVFFDATTTAQLPPRMASFAMEYLSDLDVLLLWGGSCEDDSEFHVYDIAQNNWCRIFPNLRPDRRDAMLWGLSSADNKFYVAQGDSICYNRQVLGLADVHIVDLTTIINDDGHGGGGRGGGWEMLYEPTNVPRGSGSEPYCNGNNGGFCQPRPLLQDTGSKLSTCSADLLERFFHNNDDDASKDSSSPSLPPTSTMSPTLEPSSHAADLVSLPLVWIVVLMTIVVKLFV